MRSTLTSVKTETRTERANPASERAIILLACSCIFMAVLSTNMFNVALPAIDRDFAVGSARLGWMVTAYSLVFGVSTPFYGRLGDLFGVRRFFIIGLTIFVTGSFLAMLAPSYWLLIAARAVQATGTAAIPSLGTAQIIRAIPAERRGAAMGYVAATVGVGGALGPSLGGAVTQAVSWRGLFLISALLIVIIPLVPRIMPPDKPRREGSADIPGGLIMAAMIALFLFGIANIESAGIASGVVLGLFGLSALALGVLVTHIRRSASPFIDPVLLRNRNYVLVATAAFLTMLAYTGNLVLMPLLLDRVNDLRPSEIGLALLPPAAIMTVLGPIGGRLADRFGTVVPMRAGITMMLTGYLLVSSVGAGGPVLLIVPILILIGGGLGFTNSTLTTSISLVVPPERLGLGIGLYNMLFFLGGGFGATITTALLEAREDIGDALNPLHDGLGAGFSDAALASICAATIALSLAFLARVPRPKRG